MKGKIPRLFHNLSIRTKIVLLLYTFVFILLLLISCIFLYLIDKNSKKESLISATKLVSYNNLIIEKEQQFLLGVASYFSMASEVQNILHLSNANQKTDKVSSELLNLIQSRQHILNLSLYNKNGNNIDYLTIDGSNGIIDQNPKDISRPFYRLINDRIPFIWEYIPENSQKFFTHDNSPKISLWYTVKDNTTWAPIGAIAISLDIRKLFPTDNLLNEETENIVIVNDSQKDFFGRGRFIDSFSSENIQKLLHEVMPYDNTGSFRMKINGIKYFVAYQTIPQTEFINFALVEDHHSLGNMKTVVFTFLISILLCLISMLPILIFISNFLTRPLNRLMTSMKSFRDGNRNVTISFKYHDEIGNLGEIFNSMVAENNELIEKTYMLTIRNQEAELSKLQAQINPHFIYNTLNELQWLAIDKGDNEIAEMVYEMGKLFKISLNHGRDVIAVAEERDLLVTYLYLQKKRFVDRISYELHFADDILSVKIPKLLIQPLVENSSIHGVGDANSRIKIIIRAEQGEPHRLRIVVTDNGIGIPPEKLKLLPDKLPDNSTGKSGTHFALRNIARRLALYYDDDYVFRIESKVGVGTEITIDVPFEQHHEF